jgi:HPt (histidine-containing phosphotransfer) domain-containing protein
MTANVSRSSIAACLEAGMDGFLGKPVVVADLAAVLNDVPVPASEGREPSSSPEGSLDAGVLQQLDDDLGADTVADLVRTYREDLLALLPALTDAAEQSDTTTVTSLAHRLRSASRTLGALRLADLLDALDDDPPGLADLPAAAHAAAREGRRVSDELDALAEQPRRT